MVEKILLSVFNFLFFVVLSILFLPAWLIVNYLQETWSDRLKDLFGA